MQAREKMSYIGKEVTGIIRSNDANLIEDYIKKSRNDGISIYIISSPREKILLPDDVAIEEMPDDLESIRCQLAGVEKGNPVIYSRDNKFNYAKMVMYKSEESYLFVSYSFDFIKSAMNKLLIYFTVVGLIVVLLTALISYSISLKLSGGLKTLSATAIKFSKGDFGVNFENAEYQELAALSDTLNAVRDEVKKSGDLQKELIANVSHDLKTPLTMIKAYASMIKEISGDNPEKRNQHLQVIIDESDRLTGLVNDMLNVSKVNSGVDEINFKVFNLTEYLYGIINKFDYLQETQGYTFMVDIDQNLYTRADEEKIGQVFYNLLSNAVNYTGEDKTVYISLKSSLTEERIRFTLRDTGKGIAKEDLPDIWNRYYRVKETHLRPVKGTGLGLNIVKIILQNHSFDFGVDSEPGKGSVFWVDFPSVPSEI